MPRLKNHGIDCGQTAMATVRKSIHPTVDAEWDKFCPSLFFLFSFSFLSTHCIVVAGFCYWREMNVNLGEAMKLIFPGNLSN